MSIGHRNVCPENLSSSSPFFLLTFDNKKDYQYNDGHHPNNFFIITETNKENRIEYRN